MGIYIKFKTKRRLTFKIYQKKLKAFSAGQGRIRFQAS
jgi:hypothetical protein